MKAEPDSRSESTSEVLFGEEVDVLEHAGKWCRIQVRRDGYEGFVETAVCEDFSTASTHWVSTRATFLFEQPNIKSQALQRVLFGSELVVSDTEKSSKNHPDFLQIDNKLFVWARHCLKKNVPLKLPMVEIATSHYINTPYLWGGRSTDGCDCSGLVQMLAMATGKRVPRDSGDQEAALDSTVEFSNRAAEDLVYWPGHVGVLKSADTLLHATAHSMRCCVEPIAEVIKRAGAPSSIQRLGRN